MSKTDELRQELQKARKELVAKGCRWDPETGNFMDIKPFEIAYQDAIEKVFPGCIWWELTDYWDIFDAMVQGINDEDMIEEIIAHIDPEALEEGSWVIKEDEDGDPIIADVDDEPEVQYYECDFELEKPEDGTYSICIKGTRKPTPAEAERFCKRDMALMKLTKCVNVFGPISREEAVMFYDMDNEENFPIFGEEEPEIGSIEEEDCEFASKLNEGTSNFGFPDHFDLLAFYTYDEFFDLMRHEDGYPNEEDFLDDDGEVDQAKYDDAVYDFVQKAMDASDICILDEESVDEMSDMIDDFNEDTKRIAYEEYEEHPDDSNLLEDIKIRIAPGYYEANYIDVEKEKYFDSMEGAFADAQLKRFSDFLARLKEHFGLTKLGVAWGPASNGETGYEVIKEGEERKNAKRKKVRFIGDPNAEQAFFNNAMGGCQGQGCFEGAEEHKGNGKSISFRTIKSHRRK